MDGRGDHDGVAGARLVNVLLLQGPTLNLLGEREPDVYGRLTLSQLHRQLRKHAQKIGVTLKAKQTNHESQLIEWMMSARKWLNALIINPAAYTHSSWALSEAVSLLKVPVVEVHMSNIYEREPFRRFSVLENVRTATFFGKGLNSYIEALDFLARDRTKQPVVQYRSVHSP